MERFYAKRNWKCTCMIQNNAWIRISCGVFFEFVVVFVCSGIHMWTKPSIEVKFIMLVSNERHSFRNVRVIKCALFQCVYYRNQFKPISIHKSNTERIWICFSHAQTTIGLRMMEFNRMCIFLYLRQIHIDCHVELVKSSDQRKIQNVSYLFLYSNSHWRSHPQKYAYIQCMFIVRYVTYLCNVHLYI